MFVSEGGSGSSNTDQILDDKVTEQENTDSQTLKKEPKKEKGSYFIITQDDQTREHITKIAVDYGILNFTSSNNLEDIYLRLLQKSALSN